jgi:hypothetical protein
VILPTDKQARKDTPIATGVLDYFPLAMAEVARVSKAGNDQHNPGQPLHWARGKSTDHADCVARHLLERGTVDEDGQRHSAKMAWRALALLQTELELAAGIDAEAAAKAPVGRLPGPGNYPEVYGGAPCGSDLGTLGTMDLAQLRLPLAGGGYTSPYRLS